uniref:Uncharacterized protein n=1 Tax=Magallana gigas TaxID=29159 RepID=K1RF57_MAGGI
MGLLAAFVGLRTSWPPRSDVVEYKVKPFADTCLIYRSPRSVNDTVQLPQDLGPALEK